MNSTLGRGVALALPPSLKKTGGPVADMLGRSKLGRHGMGSVDGGRTFTTFPGLRGGKRATECEGQVKQNGRQKIGWLRSPLPLAVSPGLLGIAYEDHHQRPPPNWRAFCKPWPTPEFIGRRPTERSWACEGGNLLGPKGSWPWRRVGPGAGPNGCGIDSAGGDGIGPCPRSTSLMAKPQGAARCFSPRPAGPWVKSLRCRQWNKVAAAPFDTKVAAMGCWRPTARAASYECAFAHPSSPRPRRQVEAASPNWSRGAQRGGQIGPMRWIAGRPPTCAWSSEKLESARLDKTGAVSAVDRLRKIAVLKRSLALPGCTTTSSGGGGLKPAPAPRRGCSDATARGSRDPGREPHRPQAHRHSRARACCATSSFSSSHMPGLAQGTEPRKLP